MYILNNRIPPAKKWGYRSSSTASEWLNVHQYTDVETCFKEIRERYKYIYTTHLGEDSAEIFDLNFTESIALVFGNERFGVSDDIRTLADGDFVIPQVGIIKSLNISVACAVTLYEAFRQKKAKGHYLENRMHPGDFTHLKKQWNIQ